MKCQISDLAKQLQEPTLTPVHDHVVETSTDQVPPAVNQSVS
jgi:hypothetical protein